MRLALALALGLTLCGCDNPHNDSALTPVDRATLAVNPSGRYQMLHITPNTVAVLDTRYGSVKACTVDGGTITVSCGVEDGAAR